MNKLEQPQVKSGINYLKNSVEFTSDATGKTFKLTDNSHYIPTVFAIHRISDSITAGIGIFSNFGLSTTWDDTWEGWSTYDALGITLDQPVAGQTAISIPKNWKDVYPLNFGVLYRVNNMFNINAGYTYDPSPVPDDTFEPSIPASDGHIYSLGTEMKIRNMRVGLYYAYKKSENRDKNNTLDDSALDGLNLLNSANGTYKSSVHMTGVDVAYFF